MRKLVFTLFASAMMFSGTITAAGAQTATPATTPSTESVQQVSSNQASAKSGTFVLNYNSNVRMDAGVVNKSIMVAQKGTKVTATHQKKYGSQTWFKVNVNGTSGWILSTLMSPATSQVSAAAPASSSALVSTAMSLQGVPYKFGGTTTAGFDCSGFTQYVFQKNGKSLSRTTLTQFAQTSAVSNPQVGDLVFFANTYRAGISHVGIYIGNNQFVHSGGSKAEVVSLSNSYWGPKFHSFRR